MSPRGTLDRPVGGSGGATGVAQGARGPATAAGGFVWLVGAGPGDPELLTRRAERVLAAAEVVFYDGLVSLEVLALAPRAQRFSVAKRALRRGRAATAASAEGGSLPAGESGLPQDAIHRLLIRAARRGKRVVRLKGGDPFVLGRGGEEALALAAAGVPFEVVPGVSSALAAPALAGIPVTHRGLASGFVVVSGHSPRSYAPVLDGLRPDAATVVVLMGVARRGELAAFLRARGWAAQTPAALLLAAATPQSHTWTGTLGELATVELPPELTEAPGTLVIGEVVSVATTLRLMLSPPEPQAVAAVGVAAPSAAYLLRPTPVPSFPLPPSPSLPTRGERGDGGVRGGGVEESSPGRGFSDSLQRSVS